MPQKARQRPDRRDWRDSWCATSPHERLIAGPEGRCRRCRSGPEAAERVVFGSPARHGDAGAAPRHAGAVGPHPAGEPRSASRRRSAASDATSSGPPALAAPSRSARSPSARSTVPAGRSGCGSTPRATCAAPRRRSCASTAAASARRPGEPRRDVPLPGRAGAGAGGRGGLPARARGSVPGRGRRLRRRVDLGVRERVGPGDRSRPHRGRRRQRRRQPGRRRGPGDRALGRPGAAVPAAPLPGHGLHHDTQSRRDVRRRVLPHRGLHGRSPRRTISSAARTARTRALSPLRATRRVSRRRTS